MDYTAYANSENPRDGRMACPVCGKTVKLLPKYRSLKKGYSVIPAHNAAVAPSASRGSSAGSEC